MAQLSAGRCGRTGIIRLFTSWLPCALIALAACGGPTEIKANLETRTGTVTLHSLNGSPTYLPAALLLAPSPTAVRLSADFTIDFSVDFDAGGAARLIPVQRVGSSAVISPSRLVGFQKLQSAFDAVDRAPDANYDFGADMPISVGDVGVVESRQHPYCANVYFTSPTIYAKFVVEAIDATARTVRLRLLADPNCGFRGLETGIPSR